MQHQLWMSLPIVNTPPHTGFINLLNLASKTSNKPWGSRIIYRRRNSGPSEEPDQAMRFSNTSVCHSAWSCSTSSCLRMHCLLLLLHHQNLSQCLSRLPGLGLRHAARLQVYCWRSSTTLFYARVVCAFIFHSCTVMIAFQQLSCTQWLTVCFHFCSCCYSVSWSDLSSFWPRWLLK